LAGRVLSITIMTSKLFYLLGDAPSTAIEVEIPSGTDEEGLQHLISSHFAIVEPAGKLRPGAEKGAA
jgi:hypothetical protein